MSLSQYSLEGHQFAVFAISLTSDLRYVVSVSNRFITWDLSTSDLTREVNPNIEGIMQQLILSPDNKWAAAFTNNNQTVLLNMLSSEFTLIDNPLKENEPVRFVYLLNQNLFICGDSMWAKFDMRGNLEEIYHNYNDPKVWPILRVEYINQKEYNVVFWSGDIDEDQMLMVYHLNHKYEELQFHGSMVFAEHHKKLYACTTQDCHIVSEYKRNDENEVWEKIRDLPRAKNDETEVVMQLKLDQKDSILYGTTSNGFVIWLLKCKSNSDNKNENDEDEIEVITLTLPYGIRNISTKMLQSNSIMLSAQRNYAIAGVRKNLYVFNVTTCKLMKVLDAHFGRIIQLEPLIVGNWNSIVTSSIDRTVKVWNINNIFEQVHVIDRHELQIDSISLSQDLGLAVTATRNCVGVWNLKTGKLISKFADSPLGAIVTHALITPDSKYIISAESGNILFWHRLTERVIFKDEQIGIRQLKLMEDGNKVLSISKPSNPSGVDFVRTTATACVRTIPDGELEYSFEYPYRSITGVPFKPAVITSDNEHIVVIAADKTNRDCVMVFNALSGTQMNKIPLKSCAIKDVSSLVALPHKGHLIAVTTSDKGAILDIRNKKHVRTIPKWGGICTKDGKFGLYAPQRGGLELIELKKGQTVKTYIPKVAEGVFTIICMFNSTDEYVLYYHSGKKTLRVFRTSDAEMIANFRCQAELSAVESTLDGRALVLGTVDGCVSVLAILDPEKKDMIQYLANMPSRDEEWAKKIEKLRAVKRFKAVGALAKLSTKFGANEDIGEIEGNDEVNED
nr:uncharacterized protein LOC111414493 [Onthophagus taurus]